MRDNKIDPKRGKRLKFGKYTQTESLLVKRCREAGIDIPSYQPINNRCLVWRQPAIKATSWGFLLPDESPSSRGILVAAGPKALDYLESNGITLGHMVVFAKYAGEEQNDQKSGVELQQRFITINDRDIEGSEDLRMQLEKGEVSYEKGIDGKRQLSRPKALSPMDTKKAKVLRLAAEGATEGERAAARAVAERLK